MPYWGYAYSVMKKSLALIALALSFAVTTWASLAVFQPKGYPSQRHLEIDFYVDNIKFLKDGVLEFAFAEDQYLRRVVRVLDQGSDDMSKGTMEMVAPEGNLTAVVCGHVQCGASQEMELICGKSLIPSHRDIDKVHQITFSTNRACAKSSQKKFVNSSK